MAQLMGKSFVARPSSPACLKAPQPPCNCQPMLPFPPLRFPPRFGFVVRKLSMWFSLLFKRFNAVASVPHWPAAFH
eukprot:4012343-Alexandrium_andersonii.AAC.2